MHHVSTITHHSIKGALMFLSHTKKVVFLGVSALSMAAFLPGCFFNPTTRDNNLATAQFTSDESSNMSADVGTIMAPASLSKTDASLDTTYINWKFHPYAYDAASMSWIRNAMFTISSGYSRTRIDTVTFYDASNQKIAAPTLATVDHISHIRHVTQTRGGDEANVVFTMNSVLTKTASDTTLVKNGNAIGTYDTETFATGTITNVTRHLVNHLWQFPESGTVSATFPNKTFTVEYLGAGTAQATLTNLKTDKVTVVNIAVDQR